MPASREQSTTYLLIDEAFMKSFFRPLLTTLLVAALGITLSACSTKQTTQTEIRSTPKIIAYYMGDGSDLGRYNINQLTHIIYSFLHLNGNQLSFDSDTDKLALQRLVALKKQHPQLKVMLSLGGWGGCETCSDIFSSADNRKLFAQSTLAIIQQYQADGIDLDWEYPTIPGYPGHKYAAHDRANFT